MEVVGIILHWITTNLFSLEDLKGNDDATVWNETNEHLIAVKVCVHYLPYLKTAMRKA